MAEARGSTNEYLLELIDILARPIQEGGEGMADNQDSPLMRLREKIASVECRNTWHETCGCDKSVRCPECNSLSE